jgi:hypothetical protein
MRYRVVGWTHFENEEIESVDASSFAESNAIIDEIRRKGYRISGWDHQEMDDCAPVLNDGIARHYSQRGWGALMAEVRGRTGDYAGYAFGSGSKLPCESFDPALFTPETDLEETFAVEVAEDIFALAQKSNRFSMEDLPALRMLAPRDTLTLCCGKRTMTVKVASVDRTRNIRRRDRVYDYVIHSKYKLIVRYEEKTEQESSS